MTVYLIEKATQLKFLRPAARMLLVKLIVLCKTYDEKTNTLIVHAYPKKVTELLGLSRRYYSFLIEELKEHDVLQSSNYGGQHIVYRINKRTIEESLPNQSNPNEIFGGEENCL